MLLFIIGIVFALIAIAFLLVGRIKTEYRCSRPVGASRPMRRLRVPSLRQLVRP